MTLSSLQRLLIKHPDSFYIRADGRIRVRFRARIRSRIAVWRGVVWRVKTRLLRRLHLATRPDLRLRAAARRLYWPRSRWPRQVQVLDRMLALVDLIAPLSRWPVPADGMRGLGES